MTQPAKLTTDTTTATTPELWVDGSMDARHTVILGSTATRMDYDGIVQHFLLLKVAHAAGAVYGRLVADEVASAERSWAQHFFQTEDDANGVQPRIRSL